MVVKHSIPPLGFPSPVAPSRPCQRILLRSPLHISVAYAENVAVGGTAGYQQHPVLRHFGRSLPGVSPGCGLAPRLVGGDIIRCCLEKERHFPHCQSHAAAQIRDRLLRSKPANEAQAKPSILAPARRSSPPGRCPHGQGGFRGNRTNESLPTEDQVNGVGITPHPSRHATALRNASRRSSDVGSRDPAKARPGGLQLDRRLGIVAAAADLRAPEHNIRAQRAPARDLKCLGHVKQVIVRCRASIAHTTNVTSSSIAADAVVTAQQSSMSKSIVRSGSVRERTKVERRFSRGFARTASTGGTRSVQWGGSVMIRTLSARESRSARDRHEVGRCRLSVPPRHVVRRRFGNDRQSTNRCSARQTQRGWGRCTTGSGSLPPSMLARNGPSVPEKFRITISGGVNGPVVSRQRRVCSNVAACSSSETHADLAAAVTLFRPETRRKHRFFAVGHQNAEWMTIESQPIG
jgi:hypothetical protein